MEVYGQNMSQQVKTSDIIKMFADMVMNGRSFDEDPSAGLLGGASQYQGLLDVQPQQFNGYYDSPNDSSARIIPPEFSFKPKINPFKGDYGFSATMKW